PSPSAMRPIGAMCTTPSGPAVVTMVSRIIGIVSALRCRGSQRWARGRRRSQILARPIDGASPGKRLILGVALSEPPSGPRLHQCGTEKEGMGAVRRNAEPGVERHRILCHVMTTSVVDVDTVLGDLDAKAVILHLLGEFGNFERRVGEWPAVVQGK